MADSNIDAARITNSVDAKVRSVRTRSLDLSFNELADMYSSAELVIAPEYQRLFRWSEGKQSRFIESLILELPIPPIYVIEREDSTYELIDGLQRISTYLHFRSLLPQEMLPDDQTVDLTLNECDIVGDLNGLTFKTLPRPLEIKLKRNFVRVEVLRKESDARLRYYMFKRLNTGGEPLQDSASTRYRADGGADSCDRQRNREQSVSLGSLTSSGRTASIIRQSTCTTTSEPHAGYPRQHRLMWMPDAECVRCQLPMQRHSLSASDVGTCLLVAAARATSMFNVPFRSVGSAS